uniref:Uncharacterized protein n=1 Tax=Cannabis sativa TaxID=3483 RepID=A0A803Q6Y5_CANSA
MTCSNRFLRTTKHSEQEAHLHLRVKLCFLQYLPRKDFQVTLWSLPSNTIPIPTIKRKEDKSSAREFPAKTHRQTSSIQGEKTPSVKEVNPTPPSIEPATKTLAHTWPPIAPSTESRQSSETLVPLYFEPKKVKEMVKCYQDWELYKATQDVREELEKKEEQLGKANKLLSATNQKVTELEMELFDELENALEEETKRVKELEDKREGFRRPNHSLTDQGDELTKFLKAEEEAHQKEIKKYESIENMVFYEFWKANPNAKFTYFPEDEMTK